MNIVKELRKKKGIQQRELAQVIQVAQPTVSEWETNKKDPSGERLKRLAEYFGVDELAILGVDVSITNEEKKEPEEKRKTERTLEAQIIADAIDKLPKKQRMIALNVLQAIFVDFDCF